MTKEITLQVCNRSIFPKMCISLAMDHTDLDDTCLRCDCLRHYHLTCVVFHQQYYFDSNTENDRQFLSFFFSPSRAPKSPFPVLTNSKSPATLGLSTRNSTKSLAILRARTLTVMVTLGLYHLIRGESSYATGWEPSLSPLLQEYTPKFPSKKPNSSAPVRAKRAVPPYQPRHVIVTKSFLLIRKIQARPHPSKVSRSL
jgi:hypothetical protein